jgi:hypothetical protein
VAYMIVLLAALVAGGLTYWLTLRSPGTEPANLTNDGDGFLPASAPSARPMTTGEDGGAYVPLGTDRRSWQTRVVGLLGLTIAVTLAAALLAFSLYQGGAMVARLISDYASK